MLSDSDIAKLCHGRIIYANVYNSAGTDAAGPHYAIIIDSDEEVAENNSYYVVVISNNQTIDPDHVLPVPSRCGLKGFVQCGWTPMVDLPGIQSLGAKLLAPELAPILSGIRRAKAAKKSKPSSSRPPRQS